jgi:hypothetical protein
MAKKKQPDDGFYRDPKTGKLDYPPGTPRRTYISARGFNYSIPKDYTVLLGGVRYFLGDPDLPKEINESGHVYKGDDIRHQFSKQGPDQGFKDILKSIKSAHHGSKINDW